MTEVDKCYESLDHDTFYNVLTEISKDSQGKIPSSVDKFIRKLKSFSFAPVTLKQYLRMETFANDDELVDVIFEILQDLISRGFYKKQESWDFQFWFIIEFYYGLALLSISSHHREQHLAWMQEISERLVSEQNRDLKIWFRNFKFLSKNYADLLPIKEFILSKVSVKEMDEFYTKNKGENL